MKRLYVGLCFGFLICSACVSELKFDGGDDEFLIIDGVITNSPGERRIFIRKQIGQRLDSTQVTATGSLFKDGNFLIDLVPELNTLIVPGEIQLEVGASYYVEIQTSEGEAYRSFPQIVVPRLVTDSLTVSANRREVGETVNGLRVFRWFVDVFANVSIPEQKVSPLYFRWQVDESWSLQEVLNPDNPFDEVNICYFEEDVSLNQPSILDGNNLAPGARRLRILSKEAGVEFSDQHYFNAYTHAINQEAFDYYEKLERLINDPRKVFLETPAPVIGNIRNQDETREERVLGFIEFSLVDTLRLSVRRGEIGRSIPNSCALNPAPDYCYDCIFRPGASYNKPAYWD